MSDMRPRDPGMASCRYMGWIFEAFEELGKDPAALLEHLPYTADYLCKQSNFIRWEELCTFCANAERVCTDEELIQLGRTALTRGSFRLFRGLARLLFSTTDLYRFVFHASSGEYTKLYPCTVTSITEVEPHRLIVDIAVTPPYQPARALDLMILGEIQAFPTVQGLPPAEADMTDIPGGVRYDVRLPKGAGLLAPVRRAFLWPFRARSMARELLEAHEELMARYRELQHEIAERRAAESALAESERRYRLLADNVGDVIWTTDLNLRFTYVSPSVYRVRGFTPEEMKGMGDDLAQRMPRDSIKALSAAFGRRQRGEPARPPDPDRQATVEVELYRKDGSTFPCEVNITTLKDEAGNPVGFLGVTRDISERKAVREALAFRSDFEHVLAQISASFLQATEEEIDDVITFALGRVERFLNIDQANVVLLDDSREHLEVSYQWTRPGVDVPNLIGLRYPVAQFPWFMQQLQMHNVIALETVEALPEEAIAERHYMLERGYRSYTAVPLVSKGVLLGDLSLITTETHSRWTEDTTNLLRFLADIIATGLERKRSTAAEHLLQLQLQQAQKLEAVGTLAGGIAHDFNNLLTGIMGGIQLGLMDLDPESDTAVHLQQAQEGAERAAELTRQLLLLSRKRDPEMGPMQVNDVVQRTARLLQRSISETIEVRVISNPGIPTIAGDGGALGQALLNLGINARDAMPNGGVLTFETDIAVIDDAYVATHADARRGRFVTIAVTDTGEGMQPDILHRIFEPFFTTKEQGKGTGLGLAMVYGCVRAHEGWITVESEEGHGTAFRLYLPLVEQPMEPSAASAENVPRGNETILLVDDTDAVLFLGRGMLERCGYQVIIAWNGEEALRKYRESDDHIAAVVTDLVMPHSGGRWLLQELRAAGATVPVILTSGYGVEGRPDELLVEGFAAYVPKPFDLQTLATEVRRVLDAQAQTAGPG